MTFHKCTISGFDQSTGRTYECEKTYFFIDRPEAIVLMPPVMHSKDKDALLLGNFAENIPQGTEIEELLLNAQTPLILADSNISETDKNTLINYSSEFEKCN